MAKLYNLARMTTATTGTGTITLGAAVSGYLTFALAGAANGDVVDYAIKDGSNSEHGTGTYTTSGTTLTRTVTSSTNGNAAINLSGTAEVFISPRAQTLNDGSLLTTGTVADARLSGNVPLKNTQNTFGALNTFSSSLTINGGALLSTVQNLFSYAGGSGSHQFTTNAGSGSSIVNPPGIGMPFWFISNDAGGSGAAGYSLHRSGAYAMNHGLNPNNYLYWGGWSDGANAIRAYLGPGGDFNVAYGIGTSNGGPVQSGDVRAYSTAKAWVRFNGVGGISYNSSFQTSSVTRSSFGVYVMNFTTAMVDGNYLVLCTPDVLGSARQGDGIHVTSAATSSVSFSIYGVTNGSTSTVAVDDNAVINVAIFR